MKKLLAIVVLATLTSCGASTQLISETPQTTRKAIVYDDKVVVVTETTITKEHYNRLITKRNNK